jgi:nicotinate-nucleotide adenylyltransferase
VGILGGTFNPPHAAHLTLARAALEQLGLERVLLMPARSAPHKPVAEDPGAQHRLRMCQLAAGGDERIGVCTLELDRPGPSYTVDTLRFIHATNPDVELTLLVGADMAQALPSWREPQEILRSATLAVAPRPDVDPAAVRRALHAVDGAAEPLFLGIPELALSSSQVRARVAAGQPVKELVGGEVAAYIARHGLYRDVPEPAR